MAARSKKQPSLYRSAPVTAMQVLEAVDDLAAYRQLIADLNDSALPETDSAEHLTRPN